jgi:hypothetical protein
MTASNEDSRIRTIRELRAVIVWDLDTAPTPRSDELPAPEGHESLKDQWLLWLKDYLTPGFYDRQTFVDNAEICYNRLQNGCMIVWLNEAAGEDDRMIQAAIVAMSDRESGKAAAMYARRILPWDRLERRLFD